MLIERQNIDGFIEIEEVREAVADFFSRNDYSGKRLLLIIPDNTRSSPVGEVRSKRSIVWLHSAPTSR